jgi:hypothetical protein
MNESWPREGASSSIGVACRSGGGEGLRHHHRFSMPIGNGVAAFPCARESSLDRELKNSIHF